MSFAITRGTVFVSCNGQVNNSSITNSSIDMNGGVITSHGAPVNGTDVVNKDYADSISGGGGVPYSTITLTGTTPYIGLAAFKGSVMLLVKNVVADGPSATFILSKSEQSREASIARMTSCDGLNTAEKLDVIWLPNEQIKIFKTGNGYDGNYQVKYIII